MPRLAFAFALAASAGCELAVDEGPRTVDVSDAGMDGAPAEPQESAAPSAPSAPSTPAAPIGSAGPDAGRPNGCDAKHASGGGCHPK